MYKSKCAEGSAITATTEDRDIGIKMKSLLILLLPVLIAAEVEDPAAPTQTTTTCKTCWTNDHTECCNEKEAQCPGSKCMTITEYCNLNGKEYWSFKKNCPLDKVCDNCFSMTTNHGLIMRVSYECATGDRSNANMIYNRKCPDELPPNGYKCPSCYRNDTNQGCESDGEVLCGGNEYQCVDFGSDLELTDGIERPMSGQGCITMYGCDMGFRYIPGAKEIKRNYLKCRPADLVTGQP